MAPTSSNPLAKRMAAFSEKVLGEEEEPVAVRSWTEAKAGKPGAKEYIHKTGTVRPAAPEPEDEEDDEAPEGHEEPGPPPRAAAQPRIDPLTGPLAVPRPRDESFDVALDAKKRHAKRGKRGIRPEEFGLVELRQATATGGRHLTRSKPENLQRGAGRIQPLASSDAAARGKKEAKSERFEVASDSGAARAPSAKDLLDFGEVEIGQQTRSGARKVGTLRVEDDEDVPKKARKRDEGT